MSYEFTPQLNLPVYKTTVELALEAELIAFDSNLFDAAMVRFGYGQQPDLSDEVMTDARAVYGAGGSVTAETFTSAYDTWVDLTNEKIGEYNFTVETTDGTTQYSANDDFEIDFENGRIKVLSTGTMADATNYNIDYNYNKGQRLISGLTSATEYYYRGYLQPIIFDSDSMVETALNNNGMANDLFLNMNAVQGMKTNSNIISLIQQSSYGIQNFINSSVAMTGFLTQNFVSEIYSNANAWLDGYITGNIDTIGSDYVQTISVDWSIGNLYLAQNIDITDYKTVYIDWSCTGSSYAEGDFNVGSANITFGSAFGRKTQSLDVSALEGLVEISTRFQVKDLGTFNMKVYGIWAE